MRQIVYSMKFEGRIVPTSTPNVLRATTTARSCSVTTRVGPEGVSSSIEPAEGDQAGFESEVVFADESAFQESGSISFGAGHRLRFSTIGQGYIAPSPVPGTKHGSVIWQVDGGEGQLDGVRGLITSNFLVAEDGAVTDLHTGLLYLP